MLLFHYIETGDDIQIVTTISETAAEESSSEQESALKSKIGPPPGLLPLEKISSTSSSSEVRVPRNNAMKPTEKTKSTEPVPNSNPRPTGKKDSGKELYKDSDSTQICDSLHDHIVIEVILSYLIFYLAISYKIIYH